MDKIDTLSRIEMCLLQKLEVTLYYTVKFECTILLQ